MGQTWRDKLQFWKVYIQYKYTDIYSYHISILESIHIIDIYIYSYNISILIYTDIFYILYPLAANSYNCFIVFILHTYIVSMNDLDGSGLSQGAYLITPCMNYLGDDGNS